ncbi:FliH/SctL family protein [Herbaspirillum seropedicae]|uniref:FliH/SctL family protein n=1 Tax=Herbaspirillum seropedicae TaxID=964 RepID=UPI003D98210C
MSTSLTTVSPILSQASVKRHPRLLGRPQYGKTVIADGSSLQAMLPVAQPATPDVQSEVSLNTLDLVQLREQAWSAGFKQGEAAGKEEGLQRGREDAYQEGLLEGREAGLRQGLEEAKLRIKHELDEHTKALREKELQLENLLQAIPAQLARRFESSEEDMVALSHAVVLQILGSAFASHEGTRLVLTAQLKNLAQNQLVVLRVHPRDLLLLDEMSQLSELVQQGVRWEADDQVALGGCIIDTREGSLDVRLETQLRLFAELLIQTRHSSMNVNRADN